MLVHMAVGQWAGKYRAVTEVMLLPGLEQRLQLREKPHVRVPSQRRHQPWLSLPTTQSPISASWGHHPQPQKCHSRAGLHSPHPSPSLACAQGWGWGWLLCSQLDPVCKALPCQPSQTLKYLNQNMVISKVYYEWEQNCGLNTQIMRWNSAMPVMLEDGLAACSSPFLAWKFEFWGGLDCILCLCIFNVVLVCLFKQIYQIWCGKLTLSFSCLTVSLKFFSPVKLSLLN